MGVEIHGHVAPGFEAVREAFERNFRERDELGSSFAAVRAGETLVDLWGGHRDAARSRAWESDTLTTIYSTTKGVAALGCAMLVDRGILDYEAPVSRYWPEFGRHGKERVTVGMLLSHQAGLSATRESVTETDFYEPERINAMLLEQQPLFEPGSLSGYHAMTFGPLVGELVQRSAGESLGRFLRREACEPLDADFFLGLPEAEEPRVAELLPPPRNSRGDDRKPEFPTELMRLGLTNPGASPSNANTRAWRAAEIPSVNGQANARGLARLYAVLANGGESGGVKLLSRATLDRARASRSRDREKVIPFPTDWACGWMRNHQGVVFGPNKETFGHAGFGGSYGFADPKARVGVSYVMNRMALNLRADRRGLALTRALYGCL